MRRKAGRSSYELFPKNLKNQRRATLNNTNLKACEKTQTPLGNTIPRRDLYYGLVTISALIGFWQEGQHPMNLYQVRGGAYVRIERVLHALK
jgi:hypothetical protein